MCVCVGGGRAVSNSFSSPDRILRCMCVCMYVCINSSSSSIPLCLE